MLFRPGFQVLAVLAGVCLAAGCHAPRSDPATTAAAGAGPDLHPTSSSADTPPLGQVVRGGEWMLGVRTAADDLLVEDPGGDLAEDTSVSEKDRIDAHAHYATAILHELDGEAELARKEYLNAAWNEPGNEGLVLEVSRKLLQANEPEEALELLNRATARRGASGALFARLGLIQARLGRVEEAVEANRTAIKRQPRLLQAYQNLVVLHLQNQQAREAMKVLDAAARVSNPDPAFLIALAELYSSVGFQAPSENARAQARALQILERAAKLPLTDPQLALRLADGFLLTGDTEQAGRVYQQLLQTLPEAPFIRQAVRSKLAEIYLRDRDHARAIEQLEAILRDNPTDPQAHYFLGSAAHENKEYQRAMESLSRAILLKPDFKEAYYELAAAQLSADKPAEALATIDAARKRLPPDFAQEYLAGLASYHRHDYTNAIQRFTAAEIVGKASEPKRLTSFFYFQFGAAFERAANYTEAERCFEKCLELSPDFAEAQNYLGYMLADRGEQLDRARVLIGKALAAEPKNAAYLDSMGWVLFRLKRPGEALPFLLDAIRNSEEEDATVYDHLGDIYLALGRVAEAREAWSKSLAVEGSETVRKKLESLPDS